MRKAEQTRIAAEQGVGRTAWIALEKLNAFRPFMGVQLEGYRQVQAALEQLGYVVACKVAEGKVKMRVSCLPADRETERLAGRPDRAHPRLRH